MKEERELNPRIEKKRCVVVCWVLDGEIQWERRRRNFGGGG